MFEVGNRVHYTSGKYTLRENNPLLGSVFECEGTIVSHSSGSSCTVRWDNGTSNTYSDTDLDHAGEAETNPNLLFRQKKLKSGPKKKKAKWVI